MEKYDVLFCDLNGVLTDTISGEYLPKGIWDMKIKIDVLDSIKSLSPKYVFIVCNTDIDRKYTDEYRHFSEKLMYLSSCIKEYCPSVRKARGYFMVNDYEDSEYRLPSPREISNIRLYEIDPDASGILMVGCSRISNDIKECSERYSKKYNEEVDYLDVNELIELYDK